MEEFNNIQFKKPTLKENLFFLFSLLIFITYFLGYFWKIGVEKLYRPSDVLFFQYRISYLLLFFTLLLFWMFLVLNYNFLSKNNVFNILNIVLFNLICFAFFSFTFLGFNTY